MSANVTTNGNNELPEKREMVLLLKFLKKHNLKSTADVLCKEVNLQLDDLDTTNEKDITAASLIGLIGDEHQNAVGGAGIGAKGNDPEVYETALANLRTFIDESLDIYKHELSMVLYPILVQIYCKLVYYGYVQKARDLVKLYGYDVDCYYHEDLQKLVMIRQRTDLENSEFVTAMETDKFVIRMSRDSHSLFKRHIQDRKQEVIADIVAKYLHFDTYEGTARNKAQCDATAGSQIGEAKRQDNKTRVYYGLLKEVDFQSLAAPAPAAVEEEDDNDPDAPDKPKKKKPKKDPLFSKKSKSDPNAPAIDRIPLPELRDVDKLEKLKALRESSKRVLLNRDNLPSACFYTVLNTAISANCAEISDDSSMLAVGFEDSTIKVWSLTPSKLREMKSAEQLKDIDKDAEDVLVRMMDDRTSESVRVLRGHYGPIYQCTFGPEKSILLSCSEDHTIRLWSLHIWTCLVIYKGHTFPVWSVRFSPHGYYFASCSYDKTVRLWATDSNTPLRIFTGHLSDVHCVQFHPNSNYIATGSSDRTVRLWDVLNGQAVRVMTGHKKPIYILTFSTCGRYLASGSQDHSVIVWDLSHGQLVSTLKRHTNNINALSFSREGNILAAGGLDCNLTLWDFSKLVEDYLSHNSSSSHNSDLSDSDNYLLRTYATKSSPFLSLHFTRRNLLIAVGIFKS